MASTHRVGYIAVFIFFAYLFTLPIHNLTRFIITPDIGRLRLKRLVAFASVVGIFLAAMVLLFISPGFLGSADITDQYSQTVFFKGDSVIITLANVGVSYTGKLGILVPLILVGVFALAWQERRTATEKFVILLAIFLIPFLPMREYMTAFLITVFSIIIGISVYYIYKILKKHKILRAAFLIIVIGASMSFSWVMKDYWKATQPYNLTSEETYNTGMFIKYKLSRDDMFVANKGYVSSRITAFSRIASLPLAGASANSYNAQQLIYDSNFDIDINNLDIKPVKLEQLSYTTNEIFVFNDQGGIYDAAGNWEWILIYTCDHPYGKALRERHNIHYALETHDLEGKYVYWHVYGAGLLTSMREERYKIYDNSEESVWYI
jgi:hypothetical protein